jgi:hypothetical protein
LGPTRTHGRPRAREFLCRVRGAGEEAGAECFEKGGGA